MVTERGGTRRCAERGGKLDRINGKCKFESLSYAENGITDVKEAE